MNYHRIDEPGVPPFAIPEARKRDFMGFLSRRLLAIMIFAITLIFLLFGHGYQGDQQSSTMTVLADIPTDIPSTSHFHANSNTVNLSDLDHMDPSPGIASKSILKYAVIIDAGSGGTRLHVYSLKYRGKQVVSLVAEKFHEIPKGLSTFKDDLPSVRTTLIEPLIAIAKNEVPETEYSKTPIAVKATAGLRLLPIADVNNLLEQVRLSIYASPFLSFSDSVSVITGQEEGIWGWVTVNFLLNNIGHHSVEGNSPELSPVGVSTAAIMDLGGASTQLVFELDAVDKKFYEEQVAVFCSRNNPDLCNKLSSMIVKMNFSGKEYTLFQHSFLGFGLMEARKRIKQAFVASLSDASNTTSFPCFTSTHSDTISHPDVLGQFVYLNSTKLDHDQCYRRVSAIFPFDEPCLISPCIFSGIPLPPSFHNLKDIFAFSYFFDRLSPFFPGLESIPLDKVVAYTKLVCSSEDPESPNQPSRTFEADNNIIHEVLRSNPHQCLDMMYIKTLLMDAYGLSPFRSVGLVKKIHGIETCWALGTAIDLLSK